MQRDDTVGGLKGRVTDYLARHRLSKDIILLRNILQGKRSSASGTQLRCGVHCRNLGLPESDEGSSRHLKASTHSVPLIMRLTL